MNNVLAFLTVRKVVVLGICLIFSAGAFAVVMDNDREQAILVATEHGNKVDFSGELRVVRLNNRKAVNAVLPCLKDLPELRGLTIASVDLTPEDLHTIGELNSLAMLELSDCGLTGEDLTQLGNLTNVTSLNLIKNPLTDRGMQFMSSMKSLEKIDLRATPIRGNGIKYLDGLPHLRELWLTDTKIDDHTLDHCARLSRLRQLYVNQTEVTTEGLMKLANLHWLEKLAAPDRISWADRERIGDAFIASRRQARAVGADVPVHDHSPFGLNLRKRKPPADGSPRSLK